MGRFARTSVSMGSVLTVVSLVLVVAATVFVVMANFMPHAQSGTDPLVQSFVSQKVYPEGNLTYAKLYLSELVVGVKGEAYRAELRTTYMQMKDHLGDFYGMEDTNATALSSSMATGFAFTIIGSVTGGMGALLSIVSLLASPMPWMDVTRIVLFIIASISCLVALAVVAAVTKDKQFIDVTYLLKEAGILKVKLSVGFAFECVSFALYFFATVIEIALTCLCRESPSCCHKSDRDAWQSDEKSQGSVSGNNQVTYVYQ